jgi:cytochrome c biogenesis factor
VFDPQVIATSLEAARATLAGIGRVLDVLIIAAAAAVAATTLVPAVRQHLATALAALAALLGAGELALIWFHVRLWQLTELADPATGQVTGTFAVPLWIESEKLYVWALLLAVIALVLRRHADELRPMLALGTVVLTLGAVLWGRPFGEPLPDFFGQYYGYLSAWMSGDITTAFGAFQGAEGSRQFFYNAWYMWVHPPLLFLSYGAFVASFAATILMIVRRRSSYEITAYRWARFGYLPLTLGMLLGFPWAILAWQGDAWWWSGKVNMSIMMWLLYTAYLHGRLYLRRRGMWRVVAALAVLSFVALVLTYITTYVVPGAHSVA